MDERIKGLKKAMNNHTFSKVKFTDDHRNKINKQIEKHKKDITFGVMSETVKSKK